MKSLCTEIQENCTAGVYEEMEKVQYQFEGLEANHQFLCDSAKLFEKAEEELELEDVSIVFLWEKIDINMYAGLF
jgi:hypothetical protein